MISSAEIWLPNGTEQTPHDRRPRPLRPRRFADLEMLPPEPEWLWRGFLAPGWLTMLAGQPFAGKSMLVSGLLASLTDGGSFLGRPTRRSTALILTEENDSVLAERARLFELTSTASEFLGRSDTSSLQWWELVEQATELALQGRHKLLVVDTFTGLAGLGDEQENDAGAITQRLQPLVRAAARGLAVLFLHHMNAQNQPRGSRAFQAVVDISARLLRSSRSSSVIRLETTSRFPTALDATLRAELVTTKEPWLYRPLDKKGNAIAAESETATDELLLEALRSVSPGCLSYEELGRLPGLSVDKAKKRFPEWLGMKVGRRGGGRKGDPHCWYALGS